MSECASPTSAAGGVLSPDARVCSREPNTPRLPPFGPLVFPRPPPKSGKRAPPHRRGARLSALAPPCLCSVVYPAPRPLFRRSHNSPMNRLAIRSKASRTSVHYGRKAKQAVGSAVNGLASIQVLQQWSSTPSWQLARKIHQLRARDNDLRSRTLKLRKRIRGPGAGSEKTNDCLETSLHPGSQDSGRTSGTSRTHAKVSLKSGTHRLAKTPLLLSEETSRLPNGPNSR